LHIVQEREVHGQTDRQTSGRGFGSRRERCVVQAVDLTCYRLSIEFSTGIRACERRADRWGVGGGRGSGEQGRQERLAPGLTRTGTTEQRELKLKLTKKS
jgi:hypothetical protein